MTAALNLYLSTLFAEAGVVVAVGFFVYLCAKACEFVAHEWRLRQVWRDAPVVRAWDLQQQAATMLSVVPADDLTQTTHGRVREEGVHV